MNLRAKLFVLLKPVLPRRLRNLISNAYQQAAALWKYHDPYFFRSVSLEISAFCNRTCSYCPNTHHETPKEFMSEDVLAQAIKRLQEIEWTGIVDFIFFNEPLLDKRLPEIVRRLKRELPGCLPRVTTNGDALTEPLLLELVDAGVITFYVTRHIPGNFVWDNRINYLQRKYPQYVTVTDIRKVEEEVGLWNRAGLVTVEKEYKVAACRAPEGALTIDRFGNIPLCCCDYFRKNSVGDIFSRDLISIWKEGSYPYIRQQLRRGKPVLEICRNCILRVPEDTASA